MTVDLSTSGGTSQALGLPGGIADGTLTISVTGINENATAIDFGCPVARGSTGKAVKPCTAITDDIVGMALRNAEQVAADPATNIVNWTQSSEFSVAKIGHFYAAPAEDVRDGDQVIILTAAANVNTTCYASSKGGVAGAGRLAWAGAKWRAPTGTGPTITAGTMAIIELIDDNVGRTTT